MCEIYKRYLNLKKFLFNRSERADISDETIRIYISNFIVFIVKILTTKDKIEKISQIGSEIFLPEILSFV